MKRLTSLHRLVMEDSFTKIVRGTTAPGPRTREVSEYLKAVVTDQRLLNCKEVLPTKEQVYNSFYRQKLVADKKRIWDENVKRNCEMDRMSRMAFQGTALVTRPSSVSVFKAPLSTATPPVISLGCGCQCSFHIHQPRAGTGPTLHMFKSSESFGSCNSNANGSDLAPGSGNQVPGTGNLESERFVHEVFGSVSGDATVSSTDKTAALKTPVCSGSSRSYSSRKRKGSVRA